MDSENPTPLDDNENTRVNRPVDLPDEGETHATAPIPDVPLSLPETPAASVPDITPPSGIPAVPADDAELDWRNIQLSRTEFTPRDGRARERQRRRHGEAPRAGMVEPSGARAARSRQLAPTGTWRPSFVLPPFLSQFRWLLYLGGALLLFGLVLVVFGQIFAPTGVKPTPPNALWVGSEWTFALKADRSMPELVQRLRENQIGTIYAWTSYLKSDLEWSGRRNGTNTFAEVEPDVRAFLEEMRVAYPEGRIYAWISLPVGTEPNGRDMASVEIQQQVADFALYSINELGFDGVFLNIEPVWDGDEDFIALLNKVRLTIGPDVPIAAAIPPDWSPSSASQLQLRVPPLIAPGTEWALDYKRRVALLVDELAIMAYHSGLNSESGFTTADYSRWVAYQVLTYGNAVASLDVGSGEITQIIVGVPTYDAELPAHDPLIETVPAALAGVQLALSQLGEDGRYILGTAPYGEWTTDAAEWLEYKTNWGAITR